MVHNISIATVLFKIALNLIALKDIYNIFILQYWTRINYKSLQISQPLVYSETFCWDVYNT